MSKDRLTPFFFLDAEESQITQKDTLRRLYLPEILIRYHNVLHLTSTIIAK